MAYDEDLARRFRDRLAGLAGLSEKRMMGGVCFLLDGNMIGAASRSKDGAGQFMFRVGKDNEAEALTRPGAAVVAMGGRRMGGFVFVDEAACDDGAMQDWVSLALSYVTSLPPKG